MTIQLIPITDLDLKKFYDITANENFFKFLKAGEYTFDNLKKYLNEKMKINSKVFGVYYNQSIAGLMLEIPRNDHIEMGTWISEKFKGLGIGTNATAEFIKMQKSKTVIRCLVECSNQSSSKMLENNGFKIIKKSFTLNFYQIVV